MTHLLLLAHFGGLSELDHQLAIMLANSTFVGAFSFSQAPKVVDIPHREEKNDLFCSIFPTFEFANIILAWFYHYRTGGDKRLFEVAYSCYN